MASLCAGSPDSRQLLMSGRHKARYKMLPCPCGQGRQREHPKWLDGVEGSVGEGAGQVSLEPSLKGTVGEQVERPGGHQEGGRPEWRRTCMWRKERERGPLHQGKFDAGDSGEAGRKGAWQGRSGCHMGKGGTPRDRVEGPQERYPPPRDGLPGIEEETQLQAAPGSPKK